MVGDTRAMASFRRYYDGLTTLALYERMKAISPTSPSSSWFEKIDIIRPTSG